jgi:hypothetical protein
MVTDDHGSEATDKAIGESEVDPTKFAEIQKQGQILDYKNQLGISLFPQADSPGTFEVVRKWLRDCDAGHNDCSCSTDESSYPSRLLQVRDEDGTETIRLITTKNLPVRNSRYLALSHCWGSSSEEERKMKITTKANLTERTTKINLQSLPRLYQDAIQIVRCLGERYLWIDSLCIIQDSDEDWFHESMLMGRIYEHAYCTISADSASGSNSSIFKQRLEKDIASSMLQIESLKKGLPFAELYHWRILIEAEPLSTRAWAFQERQLSRRIVHYTSHQVLWECVTMNASEIFPEGLPAVPAKDKVHHTQLVGPACHMKLSTVFENLARGSNVVESSSELLMLWYWFVEEFCMRNLTMPEDRLPALSGIANSLINMTMTGKAYIAGLWRDDLHHGLLWSASKETSCTHTRLDKSAPSWSWASITGSIVFWIDCGARGFLLDVLDVSLSPMSVRNPTSRLRSGTLKVRGYLRNGRWDDTPDSLGHVRNATWTSGAKVYFVRKTILWEDGTRLQRTKVFFDVEDDSDCINGSDSLYFLCLFGDWIRTCCLVLLRVCEKENRYRRVGILQGITMLQWLRRQEKTYLEIE